MTITRTLRSLLLAASTATAILCSCDREKKQDTPLNEPQYSIYVAFTYDSTAAGTTYHCAGIWCDGKVTKLSPGRVEDVYVYDLCLAKEDSIVYASGNVEKAAMCWKNGQEIELPSGNFATGIAEDNGDVYCCGYYVKGSSEQAMLWKNGIGTELKHGIRANKVHAEDGRSYVAGYGMNEEYYCEEARYWIDGNDYVALPQTTKGEDNAAEALDIVKSESGWWAVGRERKSMAGWLPKVWIDRSNNNLENEGTLSRLNSICCEGDTYYIGGNDGRKAKYWTANQKSSTVKRPTNIASFELTKGNTQATVTGIYALDGRVYCCGYEIGTTIQPMLWVNSERISFTTPEGYFNIEPHAICVTRKK